MKSLVELEKIITKKRDALHLSIKNNVPKDTLYEKNIAVDEAINEYLRAIDYFKSKREKLMNVYSDMLNTAFKDETINRIKNDVRKDFPKITNEELDHFSNNVYVYAVLNAHNLDNNKIFGILNNLNNLYVESMQEEGIVKNKVITEQDIDYYKSLNKKYLEIVKEKIISNS